MVGVAPVHTLIPIMRSPTTSVRSNRALPVSNTMNNIILSPILGSLNATTLEPSEGYSWYGLEENRSDLVEEYKVNYAKFTFKLTSSTTADCNIMGPAEVFKFKKQ